MKPLIHTPLKSWGVYLFLAILAILVLCHPRIFSALSENAGDPPILPTEEHPSCTNFACTLTTTSTRMIAVSIDNSPEAWPQAGVASSSLVFEIPVEGGRTRLFAWFPASEIHDDLQVGPVRSVRDAFLDVGAVCDVLPFHVGGSPTALARVKAAPHGSVDEFFYGTSFVRRTSRYAPHNTYISGKNLKSLIATRRDEKPCAPFGTGKPPQFDTLSDALPTFDFGELSVDWRYATSTQRYLRYNHAKPVVDEQGTPVSMTSVLHLYTTMRTIDDKLRRDIDLTGSGTFDYFQSGKILHGTWTRPDIHSAFILHDTSGKPLQPQGPLWVTILSI